MLIQQNNGPLVVLALILLALAVGLGILLSGTEVVNPTERIQMAQITGTSAAIENSQAAAVAAATQTPLAAVLQATAVPLQLTAVHNAIIVTEEALSMQATRQSMNAQATRADLILSTQEQEIKQETQQTQTENILSLILAIVTGLAALIIVVAGAYILAQRQKAQAAIHAARAYAEQRRLFIVQAALKEQEARQPPAGKPANGRSQPALHHPTPPRQPSA